LLAIEHLLEVPSQLFLKAVAAQARTHVERGGFGDRPGLFLVTGRGIEPEAQHSDAHSNGELPDAQLLACGEAFPTGLQS
jgi:hypothetical protein